MIKPTILLVGGAWHTAAYLKPLATALEAADYPTLTLALPSVGASPAKPDFGDDVALVRSTASELTADGKNIVAVLHSFGGIVGTEALQGMGQASMKGMGVVLGLVYIAAMIPKKGDSFEAHLRSVGDKSWKPMRQALTVNGMIALPPLDAAIMFYSDLEPEESKHWTALIRPHSAAAFRSPITHETYKDIPSTYILTTKDMAFPHEYQLKTVERAGFTETKVMETGHSPFLSRPEEVRDIIISFIVGLQQRGSHRKWARGLWMMSAGLISIRNYLDR